MTLRRLAEYALRAEDGAASDAARAMLAAATDDDEAVIEGVMRYALVSLEDVEHFHSSDPYAYCVRTSGGQSFWLAPLECWAQLPSGATVMSPRGLRALGAALAEAL